MRFRAAAAPARLGDPGLAVDVHDLGVELGGSPILELAGAQLEPGNALAVTGRNGAGKTTLLRVVSGLARPSTGQVSVFGIVPDERSGKYRKLVATQLYVPPLASDLTLIEHLMLVGVSWGLTADEATVRGQEMLRRFDVDYIARHYPNEISSGERQVFSLAMALCRPSRLLVLDEPERHLDTGRITTLAEVLKQYMHDGGSVLVASHSRQLVNVLGCPVLELHRPGTSPQQS